MPGLISDICQIFCCPPRPSHIIAKFAFLPPAPTYNLVQIENSNRYKIEFKPEAGSISDDAKQRMEPFYTMSKSQNRIACLYIKYDPLINTRHNHGVNHLVASDEADRFTILFSHGNAVDIGQMAAFLQSLAQRYQVNIMVYDYSGYGASSGQTLEENLYADAEAALVELNKRYLCPYDRVVLYGQSIGTAPTVDMAKNHDVAGVILHSPLMSGFRVVCPGTSRGFCFDPFDNINKVESIRSPTLIMHGTDDEVIGIHHGRELYSRLAFPLEPLWVESAGHNDIEFFQEYVERLDKFFKEDLQHSSNLQRANPQQTTGRQSQNFNSTAESSASQTQAAKVKPRRDSTSSTDSCASNGYNPIHSSGSNRRESNYVDAHDANDSANHDDHDVVKGKPRTKHEPFHMSLKTKKKTSKQKENSAGNGSSTISLPTEMEEEQQQQLWKPNLDS